MKNIMIAIAIALVSGLLVASGAQASEGYCVTVPQAHPVNIMGPQYNNGLLPVVPARKAESEMSLSKAGEMGPVGSGHPVNIMGPRYNNGLLPVVPQTSRSEGKTKMASAGAQASGGYRATVPQAHPVNIMGPRYNDGLLPGDM